MDYDPYCLEEKIISDLNAVINKDPALEEFDFVMVEGSNNRSPVLHVHHNLGIEVWCVKNLYMYCYESCFKLQHLWRKEYRRLDDYTRAALLVNPDIVTFWNLRKKLISYRLIEYNDDLLLSKLILSRKPKSVETLAHRRWLLKHYHADSVGMLTDRNWADSELHLCTQIANKMKSNYHAWTHRQWVFLQALSQQSCDFNLWLCEFQFSENWSAFHLSDHSGWQYREFLIEQLLNNISKNEDNLVHLKEFLSAPSSSVSQLISCLISDELRRNQELICRFKIHESLWYYRRFLLIKAKEIQYPIAESEKQFLDLFEQNSSGDHQSILIERHQRWLSLCI